MLIYHVRHLEDGDLAKEILEEQVNNKWPGLAEEVEQLCKMLQIVDPKVTQDGKKAYNEVVKKACKWRDEAMMKEEMEKMKEEQRLEDERQSREDDHLRRMLETLFVCPV